VNGVRFLQRKANRKAFFTRTSDEEEKGRDRNLDTSSTIEDHPATANQSNQSDAELCVGVIHTATQTAAQRRRI